MNTMRMREEFPVISGTVEGLVYTAPVLLLILSFSPSVMSWTIPLLAMAGYRQPVLWQCVIMLPLLVIQWALMAASPWGVVLPPLLGFLLANALASSLPSERWSLEHLAWVGLLILGNFVGRFLLHGAYHAFGEAMRLFFLLGGIFCLLRLYAFLVSISHFGTPMVPTSSLSTAREVVRR